MIRKLAGGQTAEGLSERMKGVGRGSEASVELRAQERVPCSVGSLLWKVMGVHSVFSTGE